MKKAGRRCREALTAGPRLEQSLPALRPAAAAAAVATAAAALLGLVDPQRPSAQVLAIEVLDGARGIRARHLDEPEATRPAGVAVGDEAYGLDGAVLRKQLADLGVSGGKRQVAHIDLRHAIRLLKQTHYRQEC